MASNGVVKIDYAAASSDINKIGQAITILNESKDSLQRMSNTASTMTSETGDAIVEQSNKLIGQINELIAKLHGSAGLIQSTVNKYQEEDRQLAAQARGM